MDQGENTRNHDRRFGWASQRSTRTSSSRLSPSLRSSDLSSRTYTCPPFLKFIYRLAPFVSPVGAFCRDKEWDEKGSVLSNYRSLGVVSNPNLLSVRSRTPHIIETESLQVPPPIQPDSSVLDDPGSDLEEDGNSALPCFCSSNLLTFHELGL